MLLSPNQFVDTTLRDGDQAAGLGFSFEQKKDLFDLLIDSGFTHIEAGYPAAMKEQIPWLRSLAGKKAGLCLTMWCRAVEGDILEAEKAETGAVHIAFPVSERLLKTVGWSSDQALEKLTEFVGSARKRFDWVSVGLMDAMRVDKKEIGRWIREANRVKADRIRLSDTVGTATPGKIIEWAKAFRSVKGKLEFHGHNDLGMATANTVTALECGFGAVSGTLAGLGERAGNAGWDQVLFGLETGVNVNVPLNLSKTIEACRRAMDFCGETIPDSRPILGKRAFSHATGIHQAALNKDKLSFQPFLPEKFGLGETEFLAGALSGRKGVSLLLERNGVEDLQGHLDPFMAYLKGRDGERDMTGSSLARLYNDFIQEAL